MSTSRSTYTYLHADRTSGIQRPVVAVSYTHLLTTDIIVGFPGETEEDFLETMDVVEKVRYDSAFTFIYSKRTGTPAAVMEDQISEEAVKDRFDRLLKRVQEIGREMSSRDTGTCLLYTSNCEGTKR